MLWPPPPMREERPNSRSRAEEVFTPSGVVQRPARSQAPKGEDRLVNPFRLFSADDPVEDRLSFGWWNFPFAFSIGEVESVALRKEVAQVGAIVDHDPGIGDRCRDDGQEALHAGHRVGVHLEPIDLEGHRSPENAVVQPVLVVLVQVLILAPDLEGRAGPCRAEGLVDGIEGLVESIDFLGGDPFGWLVDATPVGVGGRVVQAPLAFVDPLEHGVGDGVQCGRSHGRGHLGMAHHEAISIDIDHGWEGDTLPVPDGQLVGAGS
jgi:hypothetical protein